ncbi:MAG: glycerophosphodiester phosphodiesterase family protein [Gammaproteobacteria bacterium]|nr:glycerophosphodiester phosphodiesterase family protein [Gammaproteobacteria bacterium]
MDSADEPPRATSVLVIAHRGASGYLPEHTLASYELAIRLGADFIEPDLVATRDRVLIARHENALATVRLDATGKILRDHLGRPVLAQATTDVADKPEFAERLVVKQVDGRPIAGWFSEDFTLGEIRTLRARERMPEQRPLSASHDGEYLVPTLREIIELLQRTEATTGQRVGIYPETKHPVYFAMEGRTFTGELIHTDLSERLVETLVDMEFTDPDRVFIQSFEVANLIRLKRDIMPRYGVTFPLVQLFADVHNTVYVARPYDVVYHARAGSDLQAIYGRLADLLSAGEGVTYADLASETALARMAESYACCIGPVKHNVLLLEQVSPVDADGDGVAELRLRLTGRVGAILGNAKRAGLQVHPYTVRAEERYRLLDEHNRALSAAEEVVRLILSGVDGFFIDQPDEGRAGVAMADAGLRNP